MVYPVLSAAPSFEQAIQYTQSLLEVWATGDCTEADLGQAITPLVRTANGARGFFVTYLTTDEPLADHPPAPLIQALTTAPDTVAELLVKNLVMSTAMAITHRRNGDEAAAQGSDRVQRRTRDLIQATEMPAVTTCAEAMRFSAATGEGAYQDFLDRWGYDAEQRQAMVAILNQVFGHGCPSLSQ
ncbi:MAG: hypothetical protein IGQ88_05305 [Gloeomargaritaceae cyanobacterium C42_A2020_066]|nr:hypothetical protein [Gloeomargaritaceae cyanobacterium C42_A2020_066]